MTARVLITRGEDESAAFAHALRELGLEPVVVPLTACVPIHGALQPYLQEEFEIALLTSVAAVEPLAAALALGLEEIPRIYAVGSATAHAARLAGLELQSLPASYTAAHVIDAMGILFDKRVLWPCAEEPTASTRQLLLARQAQLTQVAVYRNALPHGVGARLAEAGPFDAITFFASSAARRFVEAGGHVGDAVVVAIGPSTAAQCEELGMERIVVADPHNAQGVERVLVERFGATR